MADRTEARLESRETSALQGNSNIDRMDLFKDFSRTVGNGSGDASNTKVNEPQQLEFSNPFPSTDFMANRTDNAIPPKPLDRTQRQLQEGRTGGTGEGSRNSSDSPREGGQNVVKSDARRVNIDPQVSQQNQDAKSNFVMRNRSR